MRTIRFGRTDTQVPVISLGTWAYGGSNSAGGRQIGWSGHDDETARDALRAAHRAGITHWDTADVYGNGRSEALIGGMWGEIPRDDIFVATKFGWDPGPHKHFYEPAHVAAKLDASLRNLQTDVIDLVYLHHCDFGPDDGRLDDALGVLLRAREAGKVRFIGLSDWDPFAIMRVIARVDPDVVQPYRNVTHNAFVSSGLSTWVQEHDVGVAFFSPIRHGLLLGKYSAPTTFDDGDFRNNDAAFRDAAVLARLIDNRDALERRFGHLAEPVLNALLGALVADTPGACVLLGQRNPKQVHAAAAASAPLTDADAQMVWDLYAGLRETG